MTVSGEYDKLYLTAEVWNALYKIKALVQLGGSNFKFGSSTTRCTLLSTHYDASTAANVFSI